VFEHVTLRVSDRQASERFYDTVLRTLGIRKAHSDEELAEWGDFAVSPASEERPVTRGLHIGFRAASHAEVDAFWRTGTQAGYRDDGAPGLRPRYREDYYGSFLLDPDGNSAEAAHHGAMRGSGAIDHLWIRVADVAASKSFYEAIAPQAGFRLGAELPDLVRFVGEGGSFSLVAGPPSQNVQMTFRGAVPGVRLDPDGNRVEIVG
jgi:catechol 2,3-dioxygenase-like lactoylglutathione lyase family enzyme